VTAAQKCGQGQGTAWGRPSPTVGRETQSRSTGLQLSNRKKKKEKNWGGGRQGKKSRGKGGGAADRDGTMAADRHASGCGRHRGGAPAGGSRRTKPRHGAHPRGRPVEASAPDKAGKAPPPRERHRRTAAAHRPRPARGPHAAARPRDADGTHARGAAGDGGGGGGDGGATNGSGTGDGGGGGATPPREPYGRPRGVSDGDKDGGGGGGVMASSDARRRRGACGRAVGLGLACHSSSAGAVSCPSSPALSWHRRNRFDG